MVSMVDSEGKLVPEQGSARKVTPCPVLIRKGLDVNKIINFMSAQFNTGLSPRRLLLIFGFNRVTGISIIMSFIDKAITVLRNSGIILIPTDTHFARQPIHSPDAVEKLTLLKDRPVPER